MRRLGAPAALPLAPHHSAIEWTEEDKVRMRVLFAADADRESEVRSRIEQALSAGELTDQRGHRTHWKLLSSARCGVLAAETAHADRLTQS